MKHILFVDDEENVRDGLRRMLRPMRSLWSMSFAESGEQALELMAGQAVDVIVSDIRMPGMDGVELLSTVMNRYPNTVRIALSGHAEKDLLFEAVQITHQYLSKPCDPETLRTTVERICALQALMENRALASVVSRLDKLPSLPSQYAEIMDELRSPDASIRAVADIIERDVAMTAKILQVANSAYFSFRREILTANQAVMMLGLEAVRGLVLATKVFAQFSSGAEHLDVEALWRHSVEVGTRAKQLAEGETDETAVRESAFMAGMLHDVGKLILATADPEKIGEAKRIEQREGLADWQAEQEALGCSHMELGAYLLGLWGLPSQIVEAVAFHHAPSRCFGSEYTALAAVHVAQALIAHEQEEEVGPSRCLDVAYVQRLGLAVPGANLMGGERA